MALLAMHSLIIGLALFVVAAGAIPAHAEEPVVEEYQVKAAFLYNFAKFVQWPASAFATAQEPITICVLGKNPVENALQEIIKGKTVEGRPFALRQISDGHPCKCHILFVNSSDQKTFRPMARNLKGKGVLIVGETDGFASDGGVINFKLEHGRVRFEINVDSADQEKLRISSKLLSLAQIVRK